MARDTTGSVMRAGDVGRAARRDLQFRIPRRPVVRRGVRMRREDDTWVLDGGRKSQVLGGAFARDHLGALLEACDGSRTLDQIGETTGIGGTTDGATDGAADGAVYNLQGQRVADRLDDSVRRQIPTGVYIVNGRKVIVK